MNAVKLLKVAALSVILASIGATAVLAQQATPVKLPAGVERVTFWVPSEGRDVVLPLVEQYAGLLST